MKIRNNVLAVPDIHHRNGHQQRSFGILKIQYANNYIPNVDNYFINRLTAIHRDHNKSPGTIKLSFIYNCDWPPIITVTASR